MTISPYISFLESCFDPPIGLKNKTKQAALSLLKEPIKSRVGSHQIQKWKYTRVGKKLRSNTVQLVFITWWNKDTENPKNPTCSRFSGEVKHQPLTFASDPSTIFVLSTKACFHLGTKLPVAVSAPGSVAGPEVSVCTTEIKRTTGAEWQTHLKADTRQFKSSWPLKVVKLPVRNNDFPFKAFSNRSSTSSLRPSPATYSLSMQCISVCVSGYHAAVPYIMRTEVTVCHRLYWELLLMNRDERGRDAGPNIFHATGKSLFHLSLVLGKHTLRTPPVKSGNCVFAGSAGGHSGIFTCAWKDVSDVAG